MKTNVAKRSEPIYTHEGAVAKRITPELQLRRTVLACLLWEDGFYEDGVTIADRIATVIPKVKPEIVANIAIECREKQKLRHVPLYILREMARHKEHKKHVPETMRKVIQRSDELTEFLSIYWKDGRQPLAACVKKGLALAFTKFDEYQLAKYNRDTEVKLRDALFLCHAKPKDEEQAALWKRLINDELKTPDTWEVKLSAKDGVSKVDKWGDLLKRKRLGSLALLRNLRNMKESGIDDARLRSAILEMKADKILPFRFLAAANEVPRFDDVLSDKMLECAKFLGKLKGKTALLVDVSGSMDYGRPSRKTVLNNTQVASCLAIITREMCDDIIIGTFSNSLVEVPARRGFALSEAIKNSQPHGGTWMGGAVRDVLSDVGDKIDRIIVITDEQSHDKVPDPPKNVKGYVINVASNKNGVGYGVWTHIDGFSENTLEYIRIKEEIEAGEYQ